MDLFFIILSLAGIIALAIAFSSSDGGSSGYSDSSGSSDDAKITRVYRCMNREEADFANEAAKLLAKGLDAKRADTAEQALLQYEALYDEISSRQPLRSDHIYKEDMKDIRENYKTMAIEEWHEKADKILDKFLELYTLITDPSFKDVEKAYRSKKRCIELWQSYFYSIPDDTGIWYDGKTHMKEYLGDDYDICMETHEFLEKRLSQCIEEMKPEYKRKQNLRKQILDIVAEKQSVMRAELVKMPFEGCTVQEVTYCVKELVDSYRLVALKIGNRYFISLSDKEKAKREKKQTQKAAPEG